MTRKKSSMGSKNFFDSSYKEMLEKNEYAKKRFRAIKKTTNANGAQKEEKNDK